MGPNRHSRQQRGYNRPQPAVEFTEENWDKTLNINLKGLFFTAQAVAREMIKRRYGKIININSQMGFVALYDRAAYCASKGGVAQLTRAWRCGMGSLQHQRQRHRSHFLRDSYDHPLLADENSARKSSGGSHGSL